jgi:ferric-dicitrate binding protein FerR (iron transport regulator)
MECTECRDHLPDFLLDELPESQAVLVQEHLTLCTACQATYKQLKGTGRALEVIPSMRPATPNTEFSTRVLTAAKEESEKIIRGLPAERRLRLEARRAARQKRQAAAAAAPPPARSWRGTIPLLVAAVVVAVAAFFLFPRSVAPASSVLGSLALSVGQVEQFYQKSGQNWTAATPGQLVQTGDAFSTGADGRARFELAGGGVLLLGPDAEVRFLPSENQRPEIPIEVVRGEVGVERPAPESETTWILRCPMLSLKAGPGVKAYLTVPKDSAAFPCTITVLQGEVSYSAVGRTETTTVKAGNTVTLKKDKPDTATPATAGPPAWRPDLLTESELSGWVACPLRIVGRRSDGLLVELSYGAGRPESLEDWRCDKGFKRLSAPARGGLQFPADARFVLALPLAVPVTVEATVNPDTPKDIAWAFGMLEQPNGHVSVDLGKEAVLQVNVRPHLRAARVAYRSRPQSPERILADVTAEGVESQVTLATATGRTPALPLPKGFEGPGEVWVQSLAEGLVLDSLKITGLLPRDWLRKRLGAP